LSRLARKKMRFSASARAVKPVVAALTGRYEAAIHCSIVVCGAASGLYEKWLVNSWASVTSRAFPLPPTSGRNEGNSLPSSRVLPARTGTFT
jgi:hypothetical protein